MTYGTDQMAPTAVQELAIIHATRPLQTRAAALEGLLAGRTERLRSAVSSRQHAFFENSV